MASYRAKDFKYQNLRQRARRESERFHARLQRQKRKVTVDEQEEAGPDGPRSQGEPAKANER